MNVALSRWTVWAARGSVHTSTRIIDATFRNTLSYILHQPHAAICDMAEKGGNALLVVRPGRMSA